MENQETTNVFVKPVYDRIFIQRDPELKEKSGVLIPEQSREKPNLGTIVIVGDECVKAKKGDRIFFGQGAGLDIAIGPFVYTMLREKDIFAFTDHPPIVTGDEYKNIKLIEPA